MIEFTCLTTAYVGTFWMRRILSPPLFAVEKREMHVGDATHTSLAEVPVKLPDTAMLDDSEESESVRL